MRARHHGTYSVIDVETTGVRASDTIVEFACIAIDGTGAVMSAFDTLINPQRSPGPTWLHGITPELCASAPTFAEVAGTIHDLLVGRVLIAHRLRFDWSMLRRMFDRAGASFLREAQGICTATLADAAGLAGGLQRVARALDIPVGRAHRALDDANVTHQVWLRLRADSNLQVGQPLTAASGAHRLSRSTVRCSRTSDAIRVPQVPISGHLRG